MFSSCLQIARDFGLADEKPPPKSKPATKTAKSAAAAAALGGGGDGSTTPRNRSKADAGPPPEPLSRPEAVQAAQKKLAAFRLPTKLACGVTVTNLGSLRPHDPGGWVAVRCGAVRCGVVRCGAVRCGAVG